MNIAPDSDPEEETDPDQYKMQRTEEEQGELKLNSYVSYYFIGINPDDCSWIETFCFYPSKGRITPKCLNYEF